MGLGPGFSRPEEEGLVRGATAIIGAADTEVGRLPDRTSTQLCLEAVLGAVADAGLEVSDIDGLITCNSMVTPVMYHAELIAEATNATPVPSLATRTAIDRWPQRRSSSR